MQKLTLRVVQEILSHEALVREAYRDAVDVWTWGVGMTEASGHSVYPRYMDRPQSLRWCLQVYLQVLRDSYVPDVVACFAGFDLSEAQFGAALSFHYNTGGIRQATWVEQWKAGELADSRDSFMNWRKPPQIIPRRKKERDLFFDGVWTSDGTVKEFKVRKPAYTPDPESACRIDVRETLVDLLQG